MLEEVVTTMYWENREEVNGNWLNFTQSWGSDRKRIGAKPMECCRMLHFGPPHCLLRWQSVFVHVRQLGP